MESDFILSAKLWESSRDQQDWKDAKQAISKTGMGLLKQSPAHFIEREPFIETPEILFGRAYHTFILQPDQFEKEYFILDDTEIIEELKAEGAKSPRATNAFKHWMGIQQDKAEGKTILSADDEKRLVAMRERLLNHDYVRMLLSSGTAEQGIMGELETTAGKIGVKFIPDMRNDIKHICIELKTTVRASKLDFPKEAANYDYHIQAAFYADMLELFYGDKRRVDFYFIAQEKKPPYAFNIFEASPQFIGQGRYEYEMLLQLYKHCLDTNTWPGYQVFCPNRYGILELDLPKWAVQPLDYFIYK